MPNTGKILVIDDDADVLLAARLLLKQHVRQVDTEKNPERLAERFAAGTYDLILLDMNFTADTASGNEGFHYLHQILALDPAAVVILITAYGDVGMAVRAVKAGATDFVLKPWQNEKLIATVSAALMLRASKLEALRLRSQQEIFARDLNQPYGEMLGSSAAMHKVFGTIDKVAATDASVLILGENGTGKELVARALHRHSKRAKEVFISVDMGALSETLFESELFGHAKGSFTDAKEDRAGRFEAASGGTLFLDEIGNLSLPMQAKLLTAIESQSITRVGTNSPRHIDVRLIAATNANLATLVAEKKFRQDLLYRINTVELRLPPLRERREDILTLTEHFLAVYSKKYHRSPKPLSDAAARTLAGYSWPGNVRELQHAAERAVILSGTEAFQSEDFFTGTASQTLELSDGDSNAPGNGLVFESYNLEEVEKTVIRKMLSKHGGNISEAARELGLTRTSLYRRIERYGL
ncbi:MAG: sigma-54-dependent Fis family transcriptional regulator [Rhizobacter sp.]|nr:sigma-54-dependent Fis family transcriptional regulator [Chlorobiales bacterium]